MCPAQRVYAGFSLFMKLYLPLCPCLLTHYKARLELLAHRLQATRPPPPPPPQSATVVTAPADTALATYAALQEMLRQQRLAISVAQQRRDDLKREIDRLSRQAEADA